MKRTLPSETTLGCVGLRVGDLDRLAAFYTDIVGLQAIDRDDDMVVLGAGDRPLVTLLSDSDAPERDSTAAGLFHVAFRVPSRAALGAALKRLESQWELTGASDHRVSEALYARDPAGNGVEIYRDYPQDEWPDAPDGRVNMDTLALDLDGVRSAFNIDSSGVTRDRVPDETDIGHVHLEVTDLERSTEFYADTVGLRLRQRFGADAAFLAAGTYHHHVGINTWNRRTAPAGDGRGLAWYELCVPEPAMDALESRLSEADVIVAHDAAGTNAIDPDGIAIHFRSK